MDKGGKGGEWGAPAPCGASEVMWLVAKRDIPINILIKFCKNPIKVTEVGQLTTSTDANCRCSHV